MKKYYTTLLVLIAVGLSSCATVTQLFESREDRIAREKAEADKERAARAAGEQAGIEQRLVAFEQLQPNAAELASEGDESFFAMRKEFKEILRAIGRAYEGEAEQAQRARAIAKHSSYLLEASRLSMASSGANMAYWVLLPLIDDAYKYDAITDDELKVVREAAKARAAVRQAELKKNGTYAADKIGGNCVFSTSELPKDGKKGDIAYYFEGKRLRINVRCYTEDDVTTYSGPEGKLYMRLQINSYVGWGKPVGKPSDFKKGTKILEATFTVPQGDIKKDDFAHISASAGFEWIGSYEWRDGRQVPNWEHRRLANSSFFWEAAPKAL